MDREVCVSGIERTFPASDRGHLDAGAPERVLPCRKTTWCINAENHPPPCVEIPRQKYEPPDYGPRRSGDMRWGR